MITIIALCLIACFMLFAVGLGVAIARPRTRGASEVTVNPPAQRPISLRTVNPAQPPISLHADEMLRKVLELQEANAGWVKIYQDLNPDGDKQTSDSLGQVRGPHMFLPDTGLNVIKYACDVVIGRNSNGDRDRIAVLRQAVASIDKFK